MQFLKNEKQSWKISIGKHYKTRQSIRFYKTCAHHQKNLIRNQQLRYLNAFIPVISIPVIKRCTS